MDPRIEFMTSVGTTSPAPRDSHLLVSSIAGSGMPLILQEIKRRVFSERTR